MTVRGGVWDPGGAWVRSPQRGPGCAKNQKNNNKTTKQNKTKNHFFRILIRGTDLIGPKPMTLDDLEGQ